MRKLAPLLIAATLLAQPGQAEDLLGSWPAKNGTLFQLWAPAATSVHVIGDFTAWKPTEDLAMQQDTATGIWRLQTSRGNPGEGYQYLINGTVIHKDPHARRVDPTSRYSILYPPLDFDWGQDKPPAHRPEETVIYEMHIGAFSDPNAKDSAPGTFADAAKRLDYLATLGINTICVMPVHDFQGNHSWGYNPIDLFAVDNVYGGPDAFKSFIKACHERDIAVHLDVVHNHYGPGRIDLEGFQDPAGGRLYFYEGEQAGTPWGPRPDFGHPGVRRFISQNILMWLEEYRLDGFRWDSTVNIRAWSGGEIPDGLSLLNDIHAMIKERKPHAINIAEDSVDIGHFDGSWEYDFHHQVVPQLKADDGARDLYAVASALERKTTMHRVIYIDSHDESGNLNNNVRFAEKVSPGNPNNAHATRMTGLGSLLTMTAPGIPMILQGLEFQETGSFNDTKPLNWERVKQYAPLVLLHRDLIRLRRNLDGHGTALLGRECKVQVTDPGGAGLAYWRWNAGNMNDRMVVAVNFSSGTLRDFKVPFPMAGQWSVILNTDWKKYGGNSPEAPAGLRIASASEPAALEIPAQSALIFKRTGALETARNTGKGPDAVYLSASFNQFQADKSPMKKFQDTLWIFRKSFYATKDAVFTVTDGETALGVPEILPMDLPVHTRLAPGGNPVHIKGDLEGDVIFAFHADTMEMAVYTYDPPPPGTDPHVNRPWTDIRGKTLTGRFKGMKGQNVSIDLGGGRLASLRFSDLSAPDQEHLAAVLAP